MEQTLDQEHSSPLRKLLAKLHIATVLFLGCASFAAAVHRWQPTDPLRLIAYLCLALAGSSMKIVLPGVDGTMSVNFFFVLLTMVELDAPETLIIGCLSVFLQYFWRARNSAKLIQLAFNLSTVALAIFLSCGVYHSAWLKDRNFQFPLLLALASGTYFLLNTFPVAMIISLTGQERILDVWRKSYGWTFPYYLSGAALAAALHVTTLRYGWQVSFLALPVICLVYRTFRVYLDRVEAERERLAAECSRVEEQKRHAEDLAKLHMRTIESLALAIDAKDRTTHSHMRRVQIYAVEIGKELGLSEEELDALRAASVLHDIGKLAVPEYIISKPGKLTHEEFEKMKIHPVVGAEILECVQFPYPVVPIVRSHHEKWDGTGYPDGLKGADIPIGARILSVIDCLDALANDRQYRRALPLPEAMAVVRQESGKSFDPAIIDLLEVRYVELERMARETIGATALKLSTNIKIARGKAPAAGIESVRDLPQAKSAEWEDPASPAILVEARADLQSLADALPPLERALGREEILAAAAIRLRRAIPCETIAFYAVEGDVLSPECIVGQDRELFASLEIPLGEGLSGWVAQNKMPVVNGNPSVEFGYPCEAGKTSTLRSALSLLLAPPDARRMVVTLYRAEKDAFSHHHLRVLTDLSAQLCRLLCSTVEVIPLDAPRKARIA